jgi:cytochrome P450
MFEKEVTVFEQLHIERVGWAEFLKWLPALARDPLPSVSAFLKAKNDVFYVDLVNGQQMLLFSRPDLVKYVLKDGNEHFSRREAIKPMETFLGDGLLRSTGAFWEHMSRMMKPAFHQKQIQQYLDIIREEGDKLINYLSHAKEPVEIEKLCALSLLQLLLRTQFCDGIDYPTERILELQLSLLELHSFVSVKQRWVKNKLKTWLPGLQPQWTFRPKELDELELIIADIRKRASLNGQRSFLLETLENAVTEGRISDKQVRDEMMNFIFAGFDATAAALSWCLYASVLHESQLQTIVPELHRLNEAIVSQSEFNINAFTDTKYFVQECLRMYPPVWSLFRTSLNPQKFGNLTLAANSFIMVHIHGVHYNEEVWGDPLVFRPERFEPEEFKGKHFAFIPFGHGPRICIGKPMAMTEIQLLMAMLLTKGRFERAPNMPEPKVEPTIIRKTKKGLWLNYKPFSS